MKELVKLVLVVAAALGFIYMTTEILGYFEKKMIDDAIVKSLKRTGD